MPNRNPDFVLARLEHTSDGKTAEVIAVYFNEECYRKTTYGRQSREWVDEMNARLGIDKATALTYALCSIFKNWGNYGNVFEIVQRELNEIEEERRKVAVSTSAGAVS